MNFLTGYKTYITAVAGIVTAVSLYANGMETVPEMIQAIITCLLAAFVRSGVSASK